MENASSAEQLQFFVSCGATVVVGLFLGFYASHCFAVVVDETAGGNDEVHWPELSLFDWIGALAFLAWLLVLATIPVWIVIALIVPDLLVGPWGTGPAFLAALWLLFPIFLLSALTGQSRLVVLHGKLLRRLVRRPGSLLVFYVLTALTLGGAGALAIYALSHPLLILLAAPVAAAAFLIHARLMGRLAWLIGQRTPIESHAKKKPPQPARGLAVVDPWAIPGKARAEADGTVDRNDDPTPFPRKVDSLRSARRSANPDLDPKKRQAKPVRREEEEDEWTARKKPYAVRSAGASPPPPPPRKSGASPPPDPYDVGAIRKAEASAIRDEADEEESDAVPEIGTREEIEYRLAAHEEAPPPAHPFFSGVFTFPWSYTVARSWLFLSLWNVAFGYLVYLTVASWRPLP